MEAKRIYETRCREEVACNQFYHQEISRLGKSSKEAEKVYLRLSLISCCVVAQYDMRCFTEFTIDWQNLFQAHSKYVKARQALDASESSYQSSVSSVEETRIAWERETERSLVVFQSIEEERYAKNECYH